MLVVKSAHVQRWHIDSERPVLIELQLATQYGDNAGMVAAILSAPLAEELGVSLEMAAAAPDETPGSGPDLADVEALTGLLDLMADFSSNEQRARYLLTCNWMRDLGAHAAALNARQLDALRRDSTTPVGS